MPRPAAVANMLNHIITGFVILFLILGGIDCAFFNNRWGFGEGTPSAFLTGEDEAGTALFRLRLEYAPHQ